MKITKYLTVAGASLKELDEAVNEHISQGFQPYGNPYFSDAGEDSGVVNPFLFVQAMVQHESLKGMDASVS